MANLETLELQLKGSAESASEGISRVIRSLSALSDALTKPFSDLVDFRKELEAISRIKLPDFGKKIGSGVSRSMKQAKDAAKSAKEEFKETESAITELVKAQPFVAKPVEKWFEKSPKTMAQIRAEGEEDRLRTLYHYISSAKTPEEANLYARNAGTTVEAVKEHFGDVEAVRQQVQNLYDTLKQPVKTNLAEVTNQITGVGQAAKKSAEESMKVFLNEIDGNTSMAKKLRQDNPELAEFKQKMNDAGVSAKDFSSKLVDLDGELKSKKKDAEEASTAIGKMKTVTDNVKSGMQNLRVSIDKLPLARLGSQFVSIAKRMAIRAVIRSAVNAMKEGTQNVYEYSKAIGGTFASSIDKARASLATMKNSFGAAIAPAIQAVIPILQTLTSWAITAANAINQLLSILSGKSTWTRAIEQGTDALNDQKKAAKGAGSAVKEMLASWDELNVIQSQSGGGGGGAAADLGAGNLFEEAEFEGWVKDLNQFLQEWKPLIDALLAGTLGGILLPKIFDWLKKIFGLKTNWNLPQGMDFPEVPDDWKNFKFPEVPDDWKNFKFPDVPEGWNNFKFPEIPDLTGLTDLISKFTSFDWKKLLLTMLPAIISLLSALLSGLLGLAGASMKIKVDREEWDKFKEEVDEFTKNRKYTYIAVMFDSSYMDYTILKNKIEKWAKEPLVKYISVLFDQTYMTYNILKGKIDAWIKELKPKYISVLFDSSYMDYTVLANRIDRWVNDTPTKYIGIQFDALKYAVYLATKALIDRWVSDRPTKYVNVAIDTVSYIAFSVIANAIDNWVKRYAVKIVEVAFSATSYNNFWSIADEIDAWARQTVNKVINIVTKTSTQAAPTPEPTPEPKQRKDIFGNPITNKTQNAVNDFLENTIETLTFGLVKFNANGAYDIPMGDLFIANEAGAELVGSINGKTSVANQQQIIEGISSGVEKANSEQNVLLREQNNLLRGILEKDLSVNFGTSASFGRTIKRSLDAYNGLTGG